jgi:hypothetical protein
VGIKDFLEINDIIIDEIEKLTIPEDEKELLYKILHHEKTIHNTGKSKYQDEYKKFIEEMMLKKES